MRKSKAETAKTRERILEAASAQFLSHGITEAGLARLMRTAGLTHGGFYRHFASKDQLVAEACSQAVLSLTSGLNIALYGYVKLEASRSSAAAARRQIPIPQSQGQAGEWLCPCRTR